MFNKRHYEAISRIAARKFDLGDEAREFLGALATMFAEDNPAFNRVRFLAACGFSEED